MGCWARLYEPEKAMANFNFTIHNYTFHNLFSICSRALQVDGTFGVTAALMEMLLQSHENELHLLPARHSSWKTGRIQGLRARGNFEVSMEWDEDRLNEAVIQSFGGNPCRVRTGREVEVLFNGQRIEIQKENGTIRFDTVPGGTYILRPVRDT